MKVSLYTSDLSEMLIDRHYPDTFQMAEEAVTEHTTVINNFVGKGFYKETYFEGIHIGYGNISLANKTLISFDSDIETVEMHFTLNGSSAAYSSEFGQEVTFGPNQHNIVYAKGMRGKMEWDASDLKVFEINLLPAFFKRFLCEKVPQFDHFRQIMENGRSGLLRAGNCTINLEMFQIINEIIHCTRKGLFKRMFLEAKVIELLLLQLEQLCNENISVIKKTDIDKMYAVREFILENLSQPCSLTELAHRAGTNEFTLKKGFRELFGTTVFGFWNDTKMEEARKMLQNGSNVSKVSDAIGYKNPQHFSAAFKRRFGIVPSQFKSV